MYPQGKYFPIKRYRQTKIHKNINRQAKYAKRRQNE
jgi:hypothetical protein